MGSLDLVRSIQEQLLNHYKSDALLNNHMELLRIKRSIDIWHIVDSEKYYICFLEGSACLEEKIIRNPAFDKKVSNTTLLFKNEIYDLEKYFLEKDSQKSLQTLTSCHIMLIEKVYIHILLESSFPLDKQLFQKHIYHSGINMLQRKVKWLSLPADERLYEVLRWCIYSTEEKILPRYITQDTISKITNSSREYTNMLLRKLQRDGLITLRPITIK